MAKQATSTKRRSTKSAGTKQAAGDDLDFQFRELIKDREVESVFCALAVGLCVGAALGALFARPARHESWTDRITAEGLGRKLLDNLERIVPSAIADKLHK